jgi:hypothetical protein
MYNVNKKIHNKYGNIIEIIREESGEFDSPYSVANKARTMYRILVEETNTKVRILVDEQVLTLTKLTKWADDEYKSLPKCEECGKILSEEVFTHNFSGTALFCSQNCADKNYHFQMEKMKDEEEIEYL